MTILLFIAALLLYIVTGDTTLSAWLPFLYTIFSSLGTTLWLRRTDPNRARGRACSWFYLSWGCLSAAGKALGILVVLGLWESLTKKRIQDAEYEANGLGMLFGIVLGLMFGRIGMSRARRGRFQVFVIPRLKKICHGDFFAIGTALGDQRRINFGFFVAAVSIILP
ncbi:MAG TPA: hypothetical protein VFE24_10115, partial [Pirellulales bacterium]|nr:hypothetical protein [Pirellulales bacterium]